MYNLGEDAQEVKPPDNKGVRMIEATNSHQGVPDWMNVKEAAEYLRLPVSTIRRLTRNNEIPSRRFTPRNTRYSRTALDKWALDRERG